jgi:hypothetical protein
MRNRTNDSVLADRVWCRSLVNGGAVVVVVVVVVVVGVGFQIDCGRLGGICSCNDPAGEKVREKAAALGQIVCLRLFFKRKK